MATSENGFGMTSEQPSDLHLWLRIRRALQVTFMLALFGAVWLVGFRSESEPAVLPDTSEQFSLDLSVTDSLDHDLVYVVEQRARPKYRIFSFDPATGDDETIFTVPVDAIIYGIALHPDRTQLAVAYSTDFSVEGNGLWLLDLDTLDSDTLDSDTVELHEVSPTKPGVYLTELEWSLDGSEIFSTHVDRRDESEALGIASIDVTTGVVKVVQEQAITPAVSDSSVYYLTVDNERARRGLGIVGTDETIDVLEGERDLDHLTIRSGNDGTDEILIAVLDQQDDGLLSFGTPAAAHGNHNIRSSWWSVSPSTTDDVTPDVELIELEPVIVYDAVASDSGAIVYATLEGLSIAGVERVDLIRSRAIRFVAA